MLAKVYITLKQGVLDAQGKAVHQALGSLGFHDVEDVRIGKYMELQLNGISREKAENQVREMCDKLLANTVIESYRFDIED